MTERTTTDHNTTEHTNVEVTQHAMDLGNTLINRYMKQIVGVVVIGLVLILIAVGTFGTVGVVQQENANNHIISLATGIRDVQSNNTARAISQDKTLTELKEIEAQVLSVTGPAAQKANTQEVTLIFECLANVVDNAANKPLEFPAAVCP
jgi:hypothetical protein